MRCIDADKLYPDCMTKNGTLAISQSQVANAPTVEPTFGLFKEMLCAECEKRPQGKFDRFTKAEDLKLKGAMKNDNISGII